MTALVLITLQQFYLTPETATAINKATDYLTAHQNTDGGFSSEISLSTVFETAISYIALVSITTDNTVLGNNVIVNVTGDMATIGFEGFDIIRVIN